MFTRRTFVYHKPVYNSNASSKVKTPWQKAMSLTAQWAAGSSGTSGTGHCPSGWGESVLLSHSTSRKQGNEQDQYFLSDLHLIIGVLGFEKLIFVHVLQEERNLPTQRGYYAGVLPAASHANTAREHCVWSLSNQSAEFDLFVVFFRETLSSLRWHNSLQMQFYPPAGPKQM